MAALRDGLAALRDGQALGWSAKRTQIYRLWAACARVSTALGSLEHIKVTSLTVAIQVPASQLVSGPFRHKRDVWPCTAGSGWHRLAVKARLSPTMVVVVVRWRRKRYLLIGAAVGAEVLGYLAWRPRMLRWGATEEEAAGRLPGDEITPRPTVQSTRAITIDAPPEQVWPWIVQMGMGRAGFYTHEWVERPLGGYYAEGHSARRIHPEFQDLKVGDLVDYGGGNLVPVHQIEPFRHLVHAEAFVLRPLPSGRTRLIVRYRGTGFISPALHNLAPDAPPLSRAAAFIAAHVPGVDLLARALDFFVSDPLHHYMEAGMLKGIKSRAEGAASATKSPPDSGHDHVATG